ncbi:MAG: hypothetical protein ACI4IL_08205 [Eubacterium sp.]
MELNEAYKIIEKNLTGFNSEQGFKKASQDDKSIVFSGEKGIYRISYEASILQFDCSYEDNGEQTEYKTLSRSLFEIDTVTDKDVKSVTNELIDELEKLFNARKKTNLDKVKMPKAVSRNKAKNGLVSYDTDSLANRFGTQYPELKEAIKQNIVEYGEFLPEDFFMNHANEMILNIIRSGSAQERKKLFKLLNELFEDGTNEVQDIIAVTILGEMKNDKELMAVADEYMIEYMAGPVHEVNKLTGKKNKYTKRLANPPVYKPKKKQQRYGVTNSLVGR